MIYEYNEGAVNKPKNILIHNKLGNIDVNALKNNILLSQFIKGIFFVFVDEINNNALVALFKRELLKIGNNKLATTSIL